jgi:hypothetical protein
MSAAQTTNARRSGSGLQRAEAIAQVASVHARAGALEEGEAIIDRVFATARGALDAAGIDRSEIDSVVLAADDVADGRSITTMIHASAAGAYRNDEVRVTNGALTALGIAGLRVATGVSRLSLVASWWLPSADPSAVASASIGARDDYGFTRRERFASEPAGAGCVACVVGAELPAPVLGLEGFVWTQADFGAWLGRMDEPRASQERLGNQIRERCGGFDQDGVLAHSATGPEADWSAAIEAAGVAEGWSSRTRGDHAGVAEGLFLLADLGTTLGAGEQGLIFATGSPQFLLLESACVRRLDG